MASTPQQKIKVLRRVRSSSRSFGDYYTKRKNFEKTSWKDFNKQSKAHNSSKEDREKALDITAKLCKEVYKRWYESLKDKPEAQRFLSDSRFAPENVFADEKSTKQKMGMLHTITKSVYKLYPELSLGQYCPVLFQQGLNSRSNGEFIACSFIHFNSEASHMYKTKRKKQENECRLYLNSTAINTPIIAARVIAKAQEKGLPIYFKMKTDDDASDTLLYYCSYEEADELIDIIEEVKQEEPRLFEGTKDIPPHLGVINGYIGFGEEPKKALYIDDEKQSYSSVRDPFLNEMMKLTDQTKNGEITREQAKEIVQKLAEKYDVDNCLFINGETAKELKAAGLYDQIGKDAVPPEQLGK